MPPLRDIVVGFAFYRSSWSWPWVLPLEFAEKGGVEKGSGKRFSTTTLSEDKARL